MNYNYYYVSYLSFSEMTGMGHHFVDQEGPMDLPYP